MRWETLEDALAVLETEREYDGYFCSVQDAVIIVILGSLCDLQSVKKIHEWAMTEHVRKFLEETFGKRYGSKRKVVVKPACNHTSGIIE